MNTDNTKTVYDIHCHALNLSHPGLTTLLNRVLSEISLLKIFKWNLVAFVVFASIPVGLHYFTEYLFSNCMVDIPLLKSVIRVVITLSIIICLFYIGKAWFKEKRKRIYNILSLMENNLGSYFLLVEEDIKKSKFFNKEGYSRCILTPLVIDFGDYASAVSGIHYKASKYRPMIEQVEDLFNGIYRYNRDSADNVLEIYPFMGINTQNYPMCSGSPWASVQLSKGLKKKLPEKYKDTIVYIEDSMRLTVKKELDNAENVFKQLEQYVKKADRDAVKRLYQNYKYNDEKWGVRDLLEKYFKKKGDGQDEEKEYEPDYKTFSKLFNKHFPRKGKSSEDPSGENDLVYKRDIEHIKHFYFSGIKLYPPTGFDPWPTYDSDELDKVNELYTTCAELKIPITVHCSKGGFKVLKKKQVETFTDPVRWNDVLSKYKELKINFAHMGINKNKLWLRWIPGLRFDLKWFKQIVMYILDYNNVYMDFSNKGFDKKFYTQLPHFIDKTLDTIIKDKKEAGDKLGDKSLMKERVENRILFGSDLMVNLFSGESYLEYLNKAHSLAGQNRQFFTDNPHAFLFETKKTGKMK